VQITLGDALDTNIPQTLRMTFADAAVVVISTRRADTAASPKVRRKAGLHT
jgi:hypothetical protein